MTFEWLTGLWSRLGLGPSEGRMAVGTGDSYANSVLGNLDTYYATGQANVHQTAAVEFGLGMVGRAFMLAETSPAVPALTALTLSMLGRQTISRGNAVFEIFLDPATGNQRLLPVEEYEVGGDVEPSTWRYSIKRSRPTGEPVTRNVPAAGIVHVRYEPPASAPWAGVSPLVGAGVTATQLARIEQSLAYDAQIPTGALMPLPDGATTKQVKGIANAVSAGKGALSNIETTAGGFGQGPMAKPKADWEQKRFGPLVPAASISLRESTALAVLGAIGIPPSLYTSEGSALRESYRHFFTNTAEPLGKLISQELSEKLEIEVNIEFPALVKSDIAARARAYGVLIKAGMAEEDARLLTVGLRR